MPPRRRISERQIELLLEFAEDQRDIALGRFPSGPMSSQTVRKAWDCLALKLNSVALGSTKTPDQWRRYWTELKAKTKTKAANSRRQSLATGGGPNNRIFLSRMEERILALIGQVAVHGLPNVQIPFDVPVTEAVNPVTSVAVPSTSYPLSNLPIRSSPDPIIDVEWLEISPVTTPSLEHLTPNCNATHMTGYAGLLRNLQELSADRNPPLPPNAAPTPPSPTNATLTPPWPLNAAPTPPSPPNPTPTLPSPPNAAPTPPIAPAATPNLYSSNIRRRRLRRDQHVPRWAYDLQMRNIAVQEQLAASVKAIGASVDALSVALVSSVTGLEKSLNNFSSVLQQLLVRHDP